MSKIIALDTETTGLDFRFGAKPFFVTICEDNGNVHYWEWDVDPLTRNPKIVESDLDEIQTFCDNAKYVVLQNSKFDVCALRSVRPSFRWDWSKVRDTLLAGHLLASNQPHDLTTMALVYLGEDILPYETVLKQAINEARRVARKDFPEWRIAKNGLSDMPSAKGTVTKFDSWLPRAIAKSQEYPRKHPWRTVLADYANIDSSITIQLYKRQRALIKERGLWKIYCERLKVLPIIYDMEEAGVTLSGKRLNDLCKEYQEESNKAGRVCSNIAASYGAQLTLPKSGNNKSLLDFCFGSEEIAQMSPVPSMLLTPTKVSKKTARPSLDKASLEQLESTLPDSSKPLLFVKTLKAKRKRDTAIAYMEAYKRFWLPLNGKAGDWFRLHPSLNPTGTDTLRWSSSNPNEQNISKQEGFNLRYCFGPAPGREWWSLDAKNIELRLPAYESGEEEMIALFERPDEPPYYGSNHLLIFDVLHPDLFAKHGADVKKVFNSTWYQWTKNGNFAVTYGAVEESGTADRAYHVAGAQRKIKERFSKISQLNDSCIRFAERHGYVETMPDKTVDPNRGYPLLCTRTSYGRILPTVPLNYHVQGTAMWWMMKAMIRCYDFLNSISIDAYMVMQVHDELVFDFPHKPNKENLSVIKRLKSLMEKGGQDVGVPTPVSIEYHENNWAEGVSL